LQRYKIIFELWSNVVEKKRKKIKIFILTKKEAVAKVFFYHKKHKEHTKNTNY